MRLLLFLLVLSLLATAPASAVQVKVFRDNPIVGLKDPAFRDNAASLDAPEFAPAVMLVELGDARQLGPMAALDETSSLLAWGNHRVVIADGLGLPDGSVDRRDDPRFLEQMVFVYADRALARLAAMGYNLTADGPVYAYAHDPPAFRGGTIPSPSLWPDAYVPSQRQMHFMFRAPSPNGDGGTGSSAEDGEVVLHELGHIVHTRMAPHVQYTPEWYGRWAEGVGDLFAALLAEEVTEGFGDACIAEWLVTYYPPDLVPRFQSEGLDCLRVLDGDFVYPADEFGEIHRDSQFWSAAMWDVRAQVGNEATLRLLMESFPFMPEEVASFEDMGTAILMADLALYAGANNDLIYSAFAKRGIDLPPLPQELLAGATRLEPQVPAPPTIAPADPPAGEPAEEEDVPAPMVVVPVLVGVAAALRRRHGVARAELA